MKVFNSEMHLVTFLITVFEILFFFYQVIYYLSRPSDKARLYYLILLFLLISYNLASGFLPDPDLPLSTVIQYIISYGFAVVMAMYFPYYFYKVYKLAQLKFYAYWGSFLFLFLPFIVFFVIPYSITHDLETWRRCLDVVPFFYALSCLYALRKAIKARNENTDDIIYNKEAVAMYFGIMFWTFLPVIGFWETDINRVLGPLLNFKDACQIVEAVSTNTGLLIITVLFISKSVRQSKEEYDKLLSSEKKLLELNAELNNKIKERTRQIEMIMEDMQTTMVNLVHETKTPLTLLNNQLNDCIQENGETSGLRIAKACADKLTKDIINLFDLERFIKGMNVYNHDQISDFSGILKQNIELFKSYAQKKSIQINQSIDTGLYVKADPDAVSRIINNIVENAIKYSWSGQKKNDDIKNIEIKLKRDHDKIVFSVKDEGIGIPEELQIKIFEPYYQIQRRKHNFQGMGLGLAIIKETIKGLNGEISIKSKLDVGTEVSVFLSNYQPSKDETIRENIYLNKLYFLDEALNVQADTLDENKPSILLVEDNISFLNYMGNKLKGHYNVFVATNGTEAIDKLKQLNHIDLIVSDIMMDKMDGIDFYKSISNNKRLSHIPFLFISAKNNKQEKIQNIGLGAIDYLEKPFDVEELNSKINSVLTTLNRQRLALVDEASRLANRPYFKQQNNIFESNCTKYKLSEREIEIIQHLIKGQQNKEIADFLNISISTVKSHIANIFEKVNVANRTELINKLVNNDI